MTDELSCSARNSRLAKAWDINVLFFCRLVSEVRSGGTSQELLCRKLVLAQIDAAIGCKRTSSVEDIFDNQHRRGREQFLNTFKSRIIMCMNIKMSLDNARKPPC